MHELFRSVSNGSYRARSRPVEASRERMERACPGTSAPRDSSMRILWDFPHLASLRRKRWGSIRFLWSSCLREETNRSSAASLDRFLCERWKR